MFIIGVILVLIKFLSQGGLSGRSLTAVVGVYSSATGDPVHMTISLLIAVTVSILVFILLVKVFGKQMKFFRKMILTDATKTEQGYVMQSESFGFIRWKEGPYRF